MRVVGSATETRDAMCDGAFVAAPILLSSASAGGGRSLKRGRPRNAARVRIKSMVGYVPSEDDRPEGVPKVPTELTLSQQLLLRQYEEQIERMSARECQDLALEVARQMMVKVRACVRTLARHRWT